MKFLGEAGHDGGGLRREFFRLLAHDIKSSFFIGRDNSFVLRHDIIALQVYIIVSCTSSVEYIC